MLGVVVVALVAVGVVVLLQGGDGSDDEDREAYVDALLILMQSDNDLPESDVRCLAEATVNVIGLDTLREAATPEEMRADPDTNLRDRGLAPDGAQAETLYQDFQGCVDMREQFLSGVGEQLPPDAVDCVDQAVDDDLLQRLFVANLVDGDEYLTANPDLQAELNTTVAHC